MEPERGALKSRLSEKWRASGIPCGPGGALPVKECSHTQLSAARPQSTFPMEQAPKSDVGFPRLVCTGFPFSRYVSP